MSRAAPSREADLWADLALLLVAAVWGSGFVAQRTGMEYVGPFAFNAVRFAVGGLVLLPLLGWSGRRCGSTEDRRGIDKGELRGGVLLGILLFAGASFQQIGLVYTSAGKAGFITGLYVVIVPLLLALVWRERVRWSGWVGAALAATGLFLLSVRADLQLDPGDGWVLGSAVMWALHVIAIGRIAATRDPVRLAAVQYFVCSLLSLPVALLVEPGAWVGAIMAAPAILYAGVLSTGLAYTGQIIAQRHTAATHAAIILSMEAVFAALFGALFLSETLTTQQTVGCGLMLAGMLLAQLQRNR